MSKDRPEPSTPELMDEIRRLKRTTAQLRRALEEEQPRKALGEDDDKEYAWFDERPDHKQASREAVVGVVVMLVIYGIAMVVVTALIF